MNWIVYCRRHGDTRWDYGWYYPTQQEAEAFAMELVMRGYETRIAPPTG